MARELDSTEIQIHQKSNELLDALQALAQLSKDLNIHNLVIQLEALSRQLQGDSKLISPTHDIAQLYDELIACRELFHTNLTVINLAAQVEP